MLEDFRERLIDMNRLKTRDEIVKAIEQLETDRKRDRLKSTTAIQSENKRFKPEDKQHHANRDKKQEVWVYTGCLVSLAVTGVA